MGQAVALGPCLGCGLLLLAQGLQRRRYPPPPHTHTLLSLLRRLASRLPDTFPFHWSSGVLKVTRRRCCNLAPSVRSKWSQRVETDYCKITHSPEDGCLVGCCAVYSCTGRPTFRRYLLPPSSGRLLFLEFRQNANCGLGCLWWHV